MKKNLLCAVLAAAFVFLTIPAFVVPVSAASVVVDTADELREALRKDGDADIILTADIKNYKLPSDFKWDGYNSYTDQFFWATVGKGTKNLMLQGHDVDIDDDFITTAKYQKVSRYDTQTGKEYEEKTLIKGLYIQKAALLRIPSGATLNIYGYGGGMSMTAQIPSRDQMYDNRIVMQRDIFFVQDGELNVYGGTYQAGRRKDIYVANALQHNSNWATEYLWGDYVIGDYKIYNGYGEYAINGRALAQYGGNVRLNGGTFIGHGYNYTKSEDTRWMNVYRNSVLSVYGGLLEIRDGIIKGYCGADSLFKSSSSSAKIDIYSGEFIAEAPDKFLWPSTSSSGVFGWAGYHSNYMVINLEPGSTSVKDAETHDRTSMKTYDNKTVVWPAPSGFTGGTLEWSDGTSGEGKYTIGTNKTVNFTPPKTYFPKNVISGGQSVDYYWSIMVQKKDGKWANVGDGWTKGGETINLASFNDNWAEGYTYRLQAKTIETWESESHSYEITTKASNALYFTVNADKTIDSVTVDGFSQNLSTVGPNTLYSSSTGVRGVSSVWYENGNANTGTINVTSGTYQAYVELIAGNGYVFTPNTKVLIYGMANTPNFISSDGKTIHVVSPVINKACDHSESTASWEYNTEYHYKYCTVCGKTEDTGKHAFGKGASNGALTTYTCSVCGYEKTVQNGKEAVNALLLDMPALVVGEKLTAPKLAEDFANKATITGYQWYKGKGTSEKTAVGTVTASGWYTLEVTASAKSGYYFKNGAFITHSHGTKAGASASDSTITGTVYVYCSEFADGKITIPSLTPDKTLGDVLKGIVVSRSGDEKINVNYYVTYNGSKYTVKRSFDGKWSVSGGSETLEQVLAKRIVPNTYYELEIEFSAGSYYVDPEEITVDSKSYMIGYTTDSGEAWASAKATVISETDIIDRVDVYAVEFPEAGNMPCDDCSVYDDMRLTLVSSSWNAGNGFVCGEAYTFTAKVNVKDGYRFSENVTATVNGKEANVVIKGNSATVTFDSGTLGHSFSDWITTVAPTCEKEGKTERFCKICGQLESDTLPLSEHELINTAGTKSNCSVHGMKEHYECAQCGKLFDADKNETTAAELELPLDPSNHAGGQMSCDGHSHFELCLCGEKLEESAHVFGDWNVIKEPEPGVKGMKEKECAVCGYLQSEEIEALPGVHEHSFKLKFDENSHWNVCVCGEITDKAAHTFDENGVCTVCGAQKTDIPAETETTGKTPAETDKPTESGQSGGDGKTGKTNLTWLWILIIIVIAGGITAAVLIIKKKKSGAAENK